MERGEHCTYKSKSILGEIYDIVDQYSARIKCERLLLLVPSSFLLYIRKMQYNAMKCYCQCKFVSKVTEFHYFCSFRVKHCTLPSSIVFVLEGKEQFWSIIEIVIA